jgi:hypothetical protein
LGGRPIKNGLNRSHNETLYSHDGAHESRGQEMLNLSPRWMLEEDGERSFNTSCEHAAARRTKTDVMGERLYRYRQEVQAALLGRSRRRGATWASFAPVHDRDIVLHSTFFEWETVPVGFPSTHRRRLAAVNIRKYLLDMSQRPALSPFVEQIAPNTWLLRTGEPPDTPGPRMAPIVLCPVLGRGTATDNFAGCKCRTGDCKSCVCAKANRECGPACHHGVANDQCTRPVEVRPSTLAPGVPCNCSREELDAPAPSLAVWASARLQRHDLSLQERKKIRARRVTHAWRLFRRVVWAKGRRASQRKRGVAMLFFHVLVEHMSGLKVRRDPASVLYQRRLIADPGVPPIDVGDLSVPDTWVQPPRPVPGPVPRARRARGAPNQVRPPVSEEKGWEQKSDSSTSSCESSESSVNGNSYVAATQRARSQAILAALASILNRGVPN